MIVPNLMVQDMDRSVRFSRDTLGMSLDMTVTPDEKVEWPGEAAGVAFAVLGWDSGPAGISAAPCVATGR